MKTSAVKEPSAKVILTEALALIRASYWIKDEEWEGRYFDDFDGDLKLPKKHKLVDNEGGEFAVTGVCSIGAMTLTRSLISGGPRFSFDGEPSPAMTRAATVLGLVMYQEFNAGSYLEPTPVDWEPLDWIVVFNDNEDTKRGDVIRAFRKALKDPLLTSRKIYRLVESGKVEGPPFAFTSKAKAKAYRDANNNLDGCEIVEAGRTLLNQEES